jgi:hypothetical protein
MASAIPDNSRAEYGFALPSVVIPAFPVRVLARSCPFWPTPVARRFIHCHHPRAADDASD